MNVSKFFVRCYETADDGGAIIGLGKLIAFSTKKRAIEIAESLSEPAEVIKVNRSKELCYLANKTEKVFENEILKRIVPERIVPEVNVSALANTFAA